MFYVWASLFSAKFRQGGERVALMGILDVGNVHTLDL